MAFLKIGYKIKYRTIVVVNNEKKLKSYQVLLLKNKQNKKQKRGDHCIFNGIQFFDPENV